MIVNFWSWFLISSSDHLSLHDCEVEVLLRWRISENDDDKICVWFWSVSEIFYHSIRLDFFHSHSCNLCMIFYVQIACVHACVVFICFTFVCVCAA